MRVRGGNTWQLVSLDRVQDQGDGVSIALSEAAGNVVAWKVRVEVATDEGVHRLGALTTRPPTQGDPPSRIIAIARCPGVRQWRVFVRGPAGAECDVHLADGEGGDPGVTPIHHGGSYSSSGITGLVPGALPTWRARQGVMVQASHANAAGSIVSVLASGSATGLELAPGESVTLPVADASEITIHGSVPGLHFAWFIP